MEAALSTFHNLQLLADAPTRLASVNLVYPPDVAFGSLVWGVCEQVGCPCTEDNSSLQATGPG